MIVTVDVLVPVGVFVGVAVIEGVYVALAVWDGDEPVLNVAELVVVLVLEEVAVAAADFDDVWVPELVTVIVEESDCA